jgi:hypothetical protein
MEMEDIEMENVESNEEHHDSRARGSKDRRIEQLGHKRVDKEVYKIGRDRQRVLQAAQNGGDKRQWSR